MLATLAWSHDAAELINASCASKYLEFKENRAKIGLLKSTMATHLVLRPQHLFGHASALSHMELQSLQAGCVMS